MWTCRFLMLSERNGDARRAHRHLVLLLGPSFPLRQQKRILTTLASFSISLIIFLQSHAFFSFLFLFSIVFLTFFDFLLPLYFLIIQHMVLFWKCFQKQSTTPPAQKFRTFSATHGLSDLDHHALDTVLPNTREFICLLQPLHFQAECRYFVPRFSSSPRTVNKPGAV